MGTQSKDVFCFQSLARHHGIKPPLQFMHARDGAELHYRFYDSPCQNNAVILLHGSSSHGEYLHHLAKHLSSERSLGQVFVPNLRGHYRSGPVKGGCSYIGQLEDDVDDLISHCGLRNKNVFLVGHSSGGGLAIRIAGGAYGKNIAGFVLLSPAIPTAPTMRDGTAGGWAKVSLPKIILLSLLNRVGISRLNHLSVIRFNLPWEYRNGKETLSYSFNLNCSYHPRLPYHQDIAALKERFLLLAGQEDEAHDPAHYPAVMQDLASEAIIILDGVKHLDIVSNPLAMDLVADWIEKNPK